MSCSTRMMALTPAALAAPISVFISAVLLGRRDARCRLVEQDHLGVQREGDATSSSFFSPCESRREAAARAAFAGRRCGRSRARARLTAHRPDTAENSRHCLRLLRDHGSGDRLGHGQLRERSARAGRCAPCRAWPARPGPTPAMLCPLKNTCPWSAPAAGQHVDERRLAGAVRADDRHELAFARRRRRRRRARETRRSAWTRPWFRSAVRHAAASRSLAPDRTTLQSHLAAMPPGRAGRR